MNLDNVLITGASGLIGPRLVNKLLNKVNFIVGVDPVHKDLQQNITFLKLYMLVGFLGQCFIMINQI